MLMLISMKLTIWMTNWLWHNLFKMLKIVDDELVLTYSSCRSCYGTLKLI